MTYSASSAAVHRRVDIYEVLLCWDLSHIYRATTAAACTPHDDDDQHPKASESPSLPEPEPVCCRTVWYLIMDHVGSVLRVKFGDPRCGAVPCGIAVSGTRVLYLSRFVDRVRVEWMPFCRGGGKANSSTVHYPQLQQLLQS